MVPTVPGPASGPCGHRPPVRENRNYVLFTFNKIAKNGAECTCQKVNVRKRGIGIESLLIVIDSFTLLKCDSPIRTRRMQWKFHAIGD
jgi:hypothetical protein